MSSLYLGLNTKLITNLECYKLVFFFTLLTAVEPQSIIKQTTNTLLLFLQLHIHMKSQADSPSVESSQNESSLNSCISRSTPLITLDSLPVEIQMKIFEFLEVPVVCGSCVRVCKLWKNMATDQFLWRHYYVRRWYSFPSSLHIVLSPQSEQPSEPVECPETLSEETVSDFEINVIGNVEEGDVYSGSEEEPMEVENEGGGEAPVLPLIETSPISLHPQEQPIQPQADTTPPEPVPLHFEPPPWVESWKELFILRYLVERKMWQNEEPSLSTRFYRWGDVLRTDATLHSDNVVPLLSQPSFIYNLTFLAEFPISRSKEDILYIVSSEEFRTANKIDPSNCKIL